MDFNIHDEKPKDFRGKLCDTSEPKIYTWSTLNLVVYCDTVWEVLHVTLDSIIQAQDNLAMWSDELQLDNTATLGGVMMHMFMHLSKSKSLTIINWDHDD